MERWIGKVALVTGASSGIGASITKALAKRGVHVVALARRKERLEEIAKEVSSEKGKVHAVKADVTKEEDIIAAFDYAKKNLGGVDILICNAGSTITTNIKDGETQHWRTLIELNVISLGACIRETFKSLESRGLDNGHIIYINSIAGQRLPQLPGQVMYSVTKTAARIRIILDGLRIEQAARKSNTKITNLSPGAVETEFFEVAGFGDHIKQIPHLSPEDITNGVIFALSTPPDVQVQELTIRPLHSGW